MLSKADNRKKAGRSSGSGNGKFLSDLETLNKSFHGDKTLSRLASSTASSRSKSVAKLPLPDSKVKAEDAKNSAKDSSDKDKKSSIWSWKGFKALTHVRSSRFNCCFSLLVHSIEGLPAYFDDVCLVVYWKRRDGEQMTRPIRVYQGVAEFEEQLTHTCSVYGSRNGPHHSAKYEAKHFLLLASAYNAPELDLGKHRIDLTRLLPLTLEELQEEKSSGKWTTSFRLSGKARGATMNVSFGYVVIGNEPSHSTQQISQRADELSIHRGGSLPARSSVTNWPAEDIKDLHEVLPRPQSDLCDSVNTLFQKMDEEISSNLVDSVSSTNEPHKTDLLTLPDADERGCGTECEFSVIDKGVEELTKENVKPEDDLLKSPEGSRNDTEDDGAAEVALNEDISLHSFAVEIPPQNGEQLAITCNQEERENYVCSKESLMKELEAALSCTSDLVNEGLDSHEDETDDLLKTPEGSRNDTEANGAVEVALNEGLSLHSSAVERENGMCSKESLMKELEAALSYTSDLVSEGLDSQEDETDALDLENYLEVNPDYTDGRKGKSLSFDDATDSVARDFLEMLGVEHSPFGLSSESEPESPRERLLREFERDALANGGLLDFNIDCDPAESMWGTTSEDFHHSSTFEGLDDMPNMETDTFSSKIKASRLEDLETEALMREWGLNERAFQHSPPSHSTGFGSPIDLPPEDPQQLPPLAEGLGPFLQTKNGGFVRSMNPVLFKNAKNGGNLIMQASNPVVVPAEVGSGVMEILQGLAAVGIEKLSMQANRLMPLEDITGKTIHQVAWESALSLEEPESNEMLQQEPELMQHIPGGQKRVKGTSSVARSSKFDSSPISSDSEYVSIEDLAPLAMDKIEALSIEGLRIQSGMSNEDAPSNISAQSIGEFSALKGKGKATDIGSSIGLDGTCGLQLLDIKDNGENVDDGLMGLSLTLDEWMKLDSGEIDDDDLVSERTSKILAAHHATSLDHFRGRSKGEKRRGRSKKYGLLGNNFTVALMVQLRDPLRNYEPVGTPMLALIQVERVFVPPKPKIYSTVSFARNSNEEAEVTDSAKKEENAIEKAKEETIEEELIPQYKVTEVHVAGLKTEQGKKKLWGSSSQQQQSGSRWLLANGMGKKNNKHPLMKSKAVAKSSEPMKKFSEPMTAKVEPGDTLWSVSSRVHGSVAKWKELAALNPHIRNPNVVIPSETIRIR